MIKSFVRTIHKNKSQVCTPTVLFLFYSLNGFKRVNPYPSATFLKRGCRQIEVPRLLPTSDRTTGSGRLNVPKKLLRCIYLYFRSSS